MKASKISRRVALGGLTALMSGVIPALAQQSPYPSKPIKIVVGFGPGGGTDIIARLYGFKLQEALGVPVIVENKAGAQEVLAAQYLMAARPDGYTLWVGTSSALGVAPGLRTDLPYDPLKSFTHIGKIGEIDAIYGVRNSLPVNSVAELIAYARANPGKLNYASAGVGAMNNVVPEYIKARLGIDITHIPYKSDAEVARELTAGTVDFALLGSALAVPFSKEGRIRAIAVTGSERLKTLPNVPAIAESGVKEIEGLGLYVYFALMGPANMPAPIVQTLNEAITKIARSPDTVQRMESVFLRASSSTQNELRQQVEGDVARWRDFAKTGAIKIGGS